MVPALAVHSISKKFRASGLGHWTHLSVLQNISMSVAAGEIVTIAGPRNCGKSTLLRCAAGLIRPDAGHVTWFGAQAHLLSGRRTAALVGDMPRGPASLSVEDSLRYHTTMHGITPMPRAGALLEHLDRVGLGALRRGVVSRLTPSALRRLAIAEALSSGARILLLDETCSGLAAPAMEVCGELLQSLAAEGMAIAVASRERSVLATLDIRRYTLFGGSLWGGDHSTAVWTSLKTGERIRPGRLS